MNIFLAAFGGVVAGMAVYLVAPLIVNGLAPKHAPRLEEHYFRTGMGWLGRALLVKRKHGGFWLKKSTFDAKFGKEKVVINGETKHFEDPENLMSRLYGWPFGIAHEKSETIGDPRFAELGEALRERARSGDLVTQHDGEQYVNGYVRVADDDRTLVNPDHVLSLVTGDAEPGTTDWSVEVTKKSQSPFESASYVDYIGAVVAFAAPFGAIWLANEVVGGSGGGGGGGSTVGIGGFIDIAVILT